MTINRSTSFQKCSESSGYEKALDDIVNVNSLFSVAVFIGFSFTAPGQRSLDGREECNADIDLLRMLVLFEVAAFSLFLYSSLMAKALKMEFVLEKAMYKMGYLKPYARAMLISSTWASLAGF
ncbi:unnamed protein product, partial [Ilex paraguariensis]